MASVPSTAECRASRANNVTININLRMHVFWECLNGYSAYSIKSIEKKPTLKECSSTIDFGYLDPKPTGNSRHHCTAYSATPPVRWSTAPPRFTRLRYGPLRLPHTPHGFFTHVGLHQATISLRLPYPHLQLPSTHFRWTDASLSKSINFVSKRSCLLYDCFRVRLNHSSLIAPRRVGH